MTDDDLDRLLGNVDNDNEFFEARQQDLKHHEKSARKGDSNILDQSVNPLGIMDSRLSEIDFDTDISIFKDGYVETLQTQETLALKFKSVITDISIDDSVIQQLKRYTYNILKYLDSIIDQFYKFDGQNNYNSILKKAKKEFHLFFQVDEIIPNKINFIALKEIFLRVREFNSFVRKDWIDLEKVVDAINFISNAKNIYIACTEIIKEGKEFSRKTDSFIKYLASILLLPEDDFDVLDSEINNKIIFQESLNYDYSNIFILKKSDTPEKKEVDLEILKENETTKAEDNLVPEPKEDKTEFTGKIEKISNNLKKEDPNSDDPIIPTFTIKGTKVWNQKEPYILNINISNYKINLENLDQLVFFTEGEISADQIKGQIKRALLNRHRKQNNPIEDYRNFLYKILISMVNEIITKFSIPTEESNIFIYHVGPYTLYLILKDYFESNKLGICYKILIDNKISKFFPQEFLKIVILQWYEDNINSFNLDFDNISEFNKFKRLVTDDYNKKLKLNLEKARQAADQYFIKTGKRIEAHKLLKSKTRVLFTPLSILIYKRFSDKTIF